jgi:diacylglycerol kinase (CTP)
MEIIEILYSLLLSFTTIISIQFIVCWLFRSKNTDENKNNKDKLCIPRKLQHLLTGIALTYFNYKLGHIIASICITGGVILIATVDILRHRNTEFNAHMIDQFSTILRKEERNERFLGSTYFLTGVMIAVICFDSVVSSLAILYLAFGDPVASISGLMFKSKEIIKGKSISGFLGCWVACTLVTHLYLTLLVNSNTSAWVSFIYGLIAAISELITGFFDIDDNILIPTFSGVLLTLLNFNISL